MTFLLIILLVVLLFALFAGPRWYRGRTTVVEEPGTVVRRTTVVERDDVV
jgi:hypothetical protein